MGRFLFSFFSVQGPWVGTEQLRGTGAGLGGGPGLADRDAMRGLSSRAFVPGLPLALPPRARRSAGACAAEGACRGPALFSLLRAPRWGVCQAWPRTGTGTCHFVKIRTMGVGRESVHSCETKVCNCAGRFQATKSPCVKRSRPKSGRKFNSACSQRNESHISRFQKQFRGSERGLV